MGGRGVIYFLGEANMADKQPAKHDLSSKVVTDPAHPPDALLLLGIPGTSSEAGHTRLYFDPQFSSYIDIPDDAILHSQEIPRDESPFGQSYVWVKRDALMAQGKAAASRLKAGFLEGAIAQAYLSGAAGGAAAGPNIQPTLSIWCPTLGPACWPTAFRCPAHTPACPQMAPTAFQCASGPQVCLPTAVIVCQPSPFCPIPTFGLCPRPTLFCPIQTGFC